MIKPYTLRMRYILFVSICFPFIVGAQPAKEEILKHRIFKLTENIQSGETVYSNTYWFDRKGNDSARIINGRKIHINTIYKNGKIISSEHVKEEGRPDTYEYVYTAGGYKKTYTDGDYGMKSFEWYNPAGKLIKSQSPDGNTTIFKYDAKGKLLSFASDGANQGIKVKQTNNYDSKGKLVRSNYIRDKDTTVVMYTYGTNGQLTSEEEKGTSQGESILINISYQYNSMGLIEKQTTRRKWGADESVTVESYLYEQY
jgi:YD repeat-containing protein